MIQVLPPNPKFGQRFGAAIGQNLADTVPKLQQQYTLRQGLQNFQNNYQNMTPMQQLVALGSIPGASPQLIQSAGDIARQQARFDALNQSFPQENPAQPPQPLNIPPEKNQKNVPPSITETSPVQENIRPYIPKTLSQLNERANELRKANPQRYVLDPDKANQDAAEEDARNQNISQAKIAQGERQLNIENRVINSLSNQKERLNAIAPPNVYNDIENKAIDDVKNGILTPEAAAKKYGNELDAISREYASLKQLSGGIGIVTSKPSEIRSSMKSLREDFKKRNDLENFADTLITNGFSTAYAYNKAFDIKDNPKLNHLINGLPSLEKKHYGGSPIPIVEPELSKKRTQAIMPKIAQLLGKNDSILSIGRELHKRGYDPNMFMDYINKNRAALGLTERQGREFGKDRNFDRMTLGDIWMTSFGGD